MISRFKAIILQRKPSADESLHLETLLENGEIKIFKIPGILKSNKRSAFHFSPGAIYEIIFREGAEGRVIPKNTELIFSPFADKQDYPRLAAVAEIIRTAEFLKSGPENTEIFLLMYRMLATMPDEHVHVDVHLDSYYWQLLKLLGLAGDADIEAEYAAYDLQSGFLTEREFAEKPRADFLLPYAWVQRAASASGGGSASVFSDLKRVAPQPPLTAVDPAACRELIRKFLKQI